MAARMELHTWATPNGRKVSIMLEELEVAYDVRPVDLTRRQQLSADFLDLNPIGRIPVLVDPDGPNGPITLFESSAILIYLAEKTGRFLPGGGAARVEVIKWLMVQTSAVGPFCGQGQVFRRFLPELNQGATDHFTGEAERLYRVLDARLADHEYLAADYSIADIATWPWIARHDWYGMALDGFPHLARWFRLVGDRPAVKRGYLVPGDDSLVAAQIRR